MTGTATMTCPKCRGDMTRYKRNGVHVDQCEECRGVFLDRGELEQLIDATTKSIAETRSSDVDSGHSYEHRDEPHRRRRTGATSPISDFLGGGE